jgi:hypothetical protein
MALASFVPFTALPAAVTAVAVAFVPDGKRPEAAGAEQQCESDELEHAREAGNELTSIDGAHRTNLRSEATRQERRPGFFVAAHG